jgi:hypothetical protein
MSRNTFLRYLQEHDQTAFQDKYAELILSGKATSFNEGEKVYIEDNDIWGGYTKVHRPGETVNYWVYVKFLNVSG